MKCKSSTKQWINGWKKCSRCGASWGKDYGGNPPCFYKKPQGWKEPIFDGFPMKKYEPKQRSESYLEFSHDIKLDGRIII